MVEIHGNKLPVITEGNRITIKSDEGKYNLVPMCYSEEYNVWFNYNCVCEDTQHRVILWINPGSFDLPAIDGVVVFFSVQYNKDKLDYLRDEIYSYNVIDAQALTKEKPISTWAMVESTLFVRNYVKQGFKRIMFESVYLSSVITKVNQDFVIIYPVDKDDIQISSEPVTYYFCFDDEELINNEVSTQELFLLGQKEMLSVLPHRNTSDFSFGLDEPRRDCYIQFKDRGIYQDHKVINDGHDIVLFMIWNFKGNMFVTEDVWLDEIEDFVTVCYIPEEGSVDLSKDHLVAGVIISTLANRVKVLRTGEKYAMLLHSDFEEYINSVCYKMRGDMKWESITTLEG